MKNQRMMLSLCIVVLSLSASGCGTMQAYSGERLSKAETALIKSAYQLGYLAEVLSVDGQELGAAEDKAEVLPGAHTVEARLIQTGAATYIWAPVMLHLNAEAGHTYEVFGATNRGGWSRAPTKWTMWIEDKDSKLVMAGAKPIYDEGQNSGESGQ